MKTLTDKEMEALLFVIDDPAMVMDKLPKDRFAWPAVVATLNRLKADIERRCLRDPITEIDRAILKVVIEDSDWPGAYAKFHPEHVEEARGVMRHLAAHADGLGIEVDRIAYT